MRTVLLIILLLIPTICLAQTVNFVWDPHPEAAVITGFKLYQSKTSGTYTTTPVATFTSGSLTTGSIAKPTSPGRYYFVLTAFMTDAESDYSNEVSTVIKPKPPKLLSAIQVALKSPVKAVEFLAGIMTKKKGLRIVS